MASRNDITGDSIKTKTGDNTQYASGWDLIWGNKEKLKEEETSDKVETDDNKKE